MEDELTENDYNQLHYFYYEKGDITRWSGWIKKRPLFQEKHPELLCAMLQLDMAELTLNSVIKKICDEE